MRLALLLASTMLLTVAASAAEVNVPGATGSANVTVYNNDFALVSERRSFRLPAAAAQLAFTGVSTQIQPETALLDVVKGEPVKISAQNFNFNVVSQSTLLERAIGQEVTVFLPNAAGLATPARARLLSAEGPVFEIDGKIHTGVQGRIVFDSMPAGLRTTPSLILDVTGAANKDIDAEFSYLTTGLNWRADYVMQYDADAARMDLTGWATVTNTTGVDFKEAKLKLIAGEVNRVSAPREMRMMTAKAMNAPASAPAPLADGVGQQEFEGTHVYSIAKAATLADKQSKQLALMSAAGVPVLRELIFRNDQPYIYFSPMRGQPMDSNAAIELSFKNATAAKLGLPLPAGVVRVYGLDQRDSLQFMGESRIDHRAEGTEVRIALGRDVDVSATREQTAYVHASDQSDVSAWKVTFKNAKARPLRVRVLELMPASWEITKEDHPHNASNAGTVEWVIDITAKGETVLEYSVKSVR